MTTKCPQSSLKLLPKLSFKIKLNYSPNFDNKKRKSEEIKFLIFHYTGMKSEKDSIKRLTSFKSKVSCNYLIKNNGEILTLDSSQISNPPPRFLIRGFLAIRRIFLLFIYINKHKPQTSLVFTSDGWSAIEKGLMILICKLHGIKTLVFPRAGDLINQVSNSNLRLKLIRFLFSRCDIFLCQGQRWSDFAVKKLNIDELRVKVIGNWTATDEQICIGRDRNYKTINNVPKLIFVGWLENFKGVFELLNACNNLKNKGIQFHLKFVGRGSAEKSAKKYVKK